MSRLNWFLTLIIAVAATLAGCTKHQTEQVDNPRLSPGTRLQQITFHSNALGRNAVYRVSLPEVMASNARLPVIYLLHGGGGSFRDWLNFSDVSRFSAANHVLLVMPEADDSYYTNSATRPEDRYEDFITQDLIHDVETRFPIQHDRAHRAVMGVSMGGFGAVKLGLRHPELFAFVGGMSSALDVPSRPFSWKRIGQWRHHRSIFGPWDGEIQKQNDPFVLAKSADRNQLPFIFLTCGSQEGLLASNRRFDRLLTSLGLTHEFQVSFGGHDWTQWNGNLPALFESWLSHTRAQ
jgi:putative tributyrin esterase